MWLLRALVHVLSVILFQRILYIIFAYFHGANGSQGTRVFAARSLACAVWGVRYVRSVVCGWVCCLSTRASCVRFDACYECVISGVLVCFGGV